MISVIHLQNAEQDTKNTAEQKNHQGTAAADDLTFLYQVIDSNYNGKNSIKVSKCRLFHSGPFRGAGTKNVRKHI